MLSSENVREIDRIFMRNGGGADVVAKVAQQYGITESFAGSIAKVLVEKRGPNVADIVTESAPATAPSAPAAASTPLAGHNRKVLEAAKEVAIGANVADAKLAAGKGASLTHDELASLAAMHYSA